MPYFAALTGFDVQTYFAAHAENLHIRRLCNWGAPAGYGVNLPMVRLGGKFSQSPLHATPRHIHHLPNCNGNPPLPGAWNIPNCNGNPLLPEPRNIPNRNVTLPGSWNIPNCNATTRLETLTQVGGYRRNA